MWPLSISRPKMGKVRGMAAGLCVFNIQQKRRPAISPLPRPYSPPPRRLHAGSRSGGSAAVNLRPPSSSLVNYRWRWGHVRARHGGAQLNSFWYCVASRSCGAGSRPFGSTATTHSIHCVTLLQPGSSLAHSKPRSDLTLRASTSYRSMGQSRNAGSAGSLWPNASQ